MPLGLDPTSYRKRLVERAAVDQMEEDDIEACLNQDFNACEGFGFECPKEHCRQLIIVRSAIVGEVVLRICLIFKKYLRATKTLSTH